MSKQREFERLVQPHVGPLRKAALSLTRRVDTADDLIQDMLLRAWRYWDNFDPTTNTRAWLYRILYNAFVNSYRRGRVQKRKALEMSITDHDIPQAPDEPSWDDAIEAALRRIEPELREVFELRAVDGLSHKEISKALGCPLGTSCSRYYRSREQLRKLLSE